MAIKHECGCANGGANGGFVLGRRVDLEWENGKKVPELALRPKEDPEAFDFGT